MFAFRASWESQTAFIRYVAPMGAALALFFACEAIRGADARDAERSAPSARPLGSIVASAGALALGLVTFSSLAIHTEYELFGDIGLGAVTRAARTPAWLVGVDAYGGPDISVDYQRALEGLADPRHTILAVDRPYLVDYGRFDLPSLDLPGWVAAGGRFPFSRGPGPKLKTLIRAGFTTLVATDPQFDLCLKPSLVPRRTVRQVSRLL